MKIIWRLVDLLAGGVFIYAGVIKALDPVRFALDIDNYKVLPWFIGVRLAFYLPWLEIFCGLALVLRFLYRGGLSILTGLIAIFIAATVAAKVRGLDITCGCFGHASEHWSFPRHMAIDLAILAALIALLFTQRTKARL
jgi:putative oxidoreductase